MAMMRMPVVMRVVMMVIMVVVIAVLVRVIVVTHRYFVTPWNSAISSRNSRGMTSAVSSMQ